MINILTNENFAKLRYLIFFITASVIAFSTSVTYSVSDLFHEGEYVGLLWQLESYYAGEANFSLLIHGAMDYAPALLASIVYGEERIIVSTRILNTVIVLISWIIFLDLCWRLSNKDGNRVLFSIVAMLTLFFLAPKFNSTAVEIQQSFIGARDLFILLTIWFFVIQSSLTAPFPSHLFIVLGAFTSATAVFWSYDRGIMTIAFVFCIFSGLIFIKNFRGAFLLASGLVLSFVFFDTTGIFGKVHDNMSNIIYWAQYSSEIFGKIYTDPYSLVAQAILLIYAFTTFAVLYKSRKVIEKKDYFILLGLVLVQLLLLKSVFNRAGMPRISWGVWPSILIMFYVISRWRIDVRLVALPKLIISEFSNYHKRYLLVFAGMVLTMAFLPMFYKYGSFVKNVFLPKFDIDLVSEEVKQISKELSANKCNFNWSNEGVIELISRKGHCTEFPYAVYASSASESEMLTQLKKDAPSAIILDSDGSWTMNIDGRAMAERLPVIAQFISEGYPNRRKIGRYTLGLR